MEQFQFIQDLLPENAIPLASLRLVNFVAEDGKPKYRFLWEGDGPSTDIIGILEIIKAELVAQSLQFGSSND